MQINPHKAAELLGCLVRSKASVIKNPKKHLNWKLKYVKVETARANNYWN